MVVEVVQLVTANCQRIGFYRAFSCSEAQFDDGSVEPSVLKSCYRIQQPTSLRELRLPVVLSRNVGFVCRHAKPSSLNASTAASRASRIASGSDSSLIEPTVENHISDLLELLGLEDHDPIPEYLL